MSSESDLPQSKHLAQQSGGDEAEPAAPPIVTQHLPKAEPAPPPRLSVPPGRHPPNESTAAPDVSGPAPGEPTSFAGSADLRTPLPKVSIAPRAGRSERGRRGSHPLLLAVAAGVAIAALASVVYLSAGPDRPSSADARRFPGSDATGNAGGVPSGPVPGQAAIAAGPAGGDIQTPPPGQTLAPLDVTAPDPLAPSELVESPGGEITDRVDGQLQAGQFERARQMLWEALASRDTPTRTWARGLLEELDFATSAHAAQTALERLSDTQLDRLMRSDWTPPVVERLSHPALERRMLLGLREHLPAEFQRRQSAPAATASPRAADGHGDADSEVVDPGQAGTASADGPAGNTSAADRLTASGLNHREGFWLLAEDDDLRATVAELDELEGKLRERIAAWNEIRQTYRHWQLQLEQARGPGRAAQADALRRQLQSARGGLTGWMRLQSEASLAALRAQKQKDEFAAAYRQLETSAEVQTPLAELDVASNRLGPTPLFQQNARHIDDFAARVLGDEVPFVRSDVQPGVFYVDAIVCELKPWTFAIRPKVDYNLIPAQLLGEVAIDLPEDGGRTLNIGGAKFLAREVILPSLRIGRYVSRDVRAFVLPPEVRRVESFLSPSAFPGLALAPQVGDDMLSVRPVVDP